MQQRRQGLNETVVDTDGQVTYMIQAAVGRKSTVFNFIIPPLIRSCDPVVPVSPLR